MVKSHMYIDLTIFLVIFDPDFFCQAARFNFRPILVLLVLKKEGREDASKTKEGKVLSKKKLPNCMM